MNVGVGSVYWCRTFSIFAVTFQQWTFYNILMLESIKTISSNDIIAPQICQDIANSANITWQIIPIIEYRKLRDIQLKLIPFWWCYIR